MTGNIKYLIARGYESDFTLWFSRDDLIVFLEFPVDFSSTASLILFRETGEWFQGGYAPNIFFSAAQSWYRAIMIEVMMMVSWWEVVLPWGWFQFEPSQFVLFHETGIWTLLTWRIVMKLMMLYDVVGKSHREIILTSMPIENCHL